MTKQHYEPHQYEEVLKLTSVDSVIQIGDTMGGFNQHLTNPILDHLDSLADPVCTLETGYVFSDQVKQNYSNLKFKTILQDWIWGAFDQYLAHPNIEYKNFICSFNGTDHVSRQLLVSILNRFGYFDPQYSSKNFKTSTASIDGHLQQYVPGQEDFYNKFFMSSEEFNQQTYSFGHVRWQHNQNIYNLEQKLSNSFLQIVSESQATSYYPFVTEKFLYSVVTRGLFLAYAQPGWHTHLEKYYGFKKYDKLFDYRFDSITNPVERLVELITMISKFNILSPADWHDLYQIEQDTIEYNYNHYFSKKYLEYLR